MLNRYYKKGFSKESHHWNICHWCNGGECGVAYQGTYLGCNILLCSYIMLYDVSKLCK